jgi:glyoxylase-like metal-dependent hydrolase (beta-lactamase superfamily II)
MIAQLLARLRATPHNPRSRHREQGAAAMLIFRQLFDAQSSTYTYLVADRASGEAVLIDPVFEQVHRDAALLQELGLRLKWTLETHVHADHVTAAWLLRRQLGSAIALGAVT